MSRFITHFRAGNALRAASYLNKTRSMFKYPLQRNFGTTTSLSYYDPDEVSVMYHEPIVRVNQSAPSFHCEAVVDNDITEMELKDYSGKWVYLMFYPKDFTFVCPTELIAFSDRVTDFEDLNTQVLGISCDSVNSHLAWIQQPRKSGGLGRMQIPLLSDMTKYISAMYGALIEEEGIPMRASYIINPEGKLMHLSMNQNDVGRSVEEALRLIKAYQFSAKHGEVCPANWTPGASTMIADPTLSQDYFSTGITETVVENSESVNEHGILTANSAEELDALIKGDKPVVVQFSASWCGKCRQIQPVVDQLALDRPDVVFVKVDKDDKGFQSVIKDMNVEALPSFRFFKGGVTVTDGVTGYKKKPLREAVALLV